MKRKVHVLSIKKQRLKSKIYSFRLSQPVYSYTPSVHKT